MSLLTTPADRKRMLELESAAPKQEEYGWFSDWTEALDDWKKDSGYEARAFAPDASRDVETLLGLLRWMRNYFDDRADADQANQGAPQPNEEMRILTEIDWALAGQEEKP